MLAASCLCGAVRIEVTGTPRSLSYCHCGRCRKAEGVFATVMIGAAEDLRVVAGEEAIRRVEPEPPFTHRRAFCGECGSALGELASGGIYVLAASALDDDPGIRPSVHIHVASKPAWYAITDGLPQYAGDYGGALVGAG